jgi:8-oxo-dGTP pyrophosphatase MutT (NUDIX family)
MSIVSEDMVIDAVDQADSAVSQISRKDVFKEHANFRVVHILVFNSKRDLLLQRLALTRPRHAGYWGSSVAGYLHSQEGYEEAARRRIFEELGVYNAHLEAIGKTVMDDEGSRKFIEVFTTVQDGPFDYDRSHIDAVEFLPIPVIRALEQGGMRKFTPTFIHVLNFYEARLRQA